jgi:hypothetical protein
MLAFALMTLVLGVTGAFAETVTFEGLRFATPDNMPRFDGGPRPDSPFLRFRRGDDGDSQFDVIEAMSGPADPRLTPDTFGEFSLRPASMFCGEHQILRQETRSIDGAIIVDIGYLCLRHSRSPDYTRQIVRNIAVFHDGRMTLLQFVRRWRGSNPDDGLTPENWISPTDALAGSIVRCGTQCE